MSQVVFKDKAGFVLKPGDLIVYGHALGRCAGLQYGKVLAITSQKKHAYVHNKETGKYDSIEYDHAKLKVNGIAFHDNQSNQPEDTRFWRSDMAEPLRVGTLEYSSRVLKVSRSQIPAPVLKALDGIEVPE